MSIYSRFGVANVINAAGKLTALGGTAQADEVAAALAEAARWHVDLAELRARAGELIAGYCGAEGASVTPGAAAGLAISVAACVAGADPAGVARLPDSEGMTNRVLVQSGHWINFGAHVEQMVRLGGGRPVKVGRGDATEERELEEAFSDACAAFVFVKSHHTAQTGPLPLESCVAVSHARGVPVIVDAAAEEDLRRYIAMGADLVTYSGGKAFAGPTAGFVAGREDLIRACEAQQRGIARPMKTGKEQIVGLLRALELYERFDTKAESERRAEVNRTIMEAMEGRPGVEFELRPDEAGRPIERVAVSAREGKFDVRDLVRHLAEGSPSIRTRNHHLRKGVVLFDPREVTEAQAHVIASRLREFFGDRPDR